MRNKKNLLKTLSIMSLSATLLTLAPISAHAAWKQNSTGWWYTEGSSWATGWKQINGTWYFFDNNGYMKTGWLNDKGTWYYFDNSGAMKTGWLSDKGTWYYFNNSGAMKTGWANINGAWYFFDNNGYMKTSWLNDKGTWYYLDNSGAMKTGWVNDYNTWFFFDKSGAMKTGWVQVDNTCKAYFNADGSQPVGWTTIDGKTYYSKPGVGIVTYCIIDNYFVDFNGVRQKKVKYTTSEQVQALVEKEDYTFINNIKSKVPDFKCSKTTTLLESFPSAKDFGIEDEPCINLIYTSNNDEFITYNYFVGLYSGKIYITPESLGRIYEIKDNAKVKTYDNEKEYDPSQMTDWR